MMRAAICGAGIAGLALAHQLDAAGWDVTVVEKAPGPRPQGYMIDFFGPGYEAAGEMGVLPAIQETGYNVTEAVWFGDDGRRRARLGYAKIQRAVKGRLTSILRPDLERVLREHLPDRVDLRFGAQLTGVEQEPDGVRLALADGTTIEADLLAGADGIHSTVRGLVFGDEAKYLRYLGFHTAAYVFSDSAVRARVGDRFCITDSIDRQVGLYGLRDGRIAAFTVHRTPDPELPADPQATVRREYASLGWLVPAALAACPPADEIYYDQVAQTHVPRWSSGRTVLVGDACFAPSLMAGQGASLAIAGAYVLAHQLAHAGSVATALDRYESMWRPIAEDKQNAGRRGTRWFLPSSRSDLVLRRLALWATALPGVSRIVAEAMSGKPTKIIGELSRAK